MIPVRFSWALCLGLLLLGPNGGRTVSAADAIRPAVQTVQPAFIGQPAAAPSALPAGSGVEVWTISEGNWEPRLFGLFAPSDHGFSDFISPMTNPVYFEDPRTLTEARAIFLNHTVPGALGGGDVQLLAVQLRAALTENLSIIATKDGYIWSDNPVVGDGFANFSAGLKYNLFKDYDTKTIVSTGTTFEAPVGSHQSLQGRGSGEFNVFLSGGQQFWERWHAISAFGARIPANTAAQNQSLYWSNHLDRKLGDKLYLFTEMNWYHWMSSNDRFPVPVEGLDLFNIGSTGVAGNDIVTGAFGLKYKPHRHMEIGVAYEIPYTARRDIIQNRVTADLILRY